MKQITYFITKTLIESKSNTVYTLSSFKKYWSSCKNYAAVEEESMRLVCNSFVL